jgi:hypothetical protein
VTNRRRLHWFDTSEGNRRGFVPRSEYSLPRNATRGPGGASRYCERVKVSVVASLLLPITRAPRTRREAPVGPLVTASG